MATHDESHLFSLAALTARPPAPAHEPPPGTPAPQRLDAGRAADQLPAAPNNGWPLFPLGAPLGSPAPLEPAPRGRGLRRVVSPVTVLVAGALLLGAGIVLTAVWSGDAGESQASLVPETFTETLVPPLRDVRASLELPSPPAAASHAGVAEAPHAPATNPNRGTLRPRPRPNRQPAPKLATPPPARGRCAHCAPQDLACNIKCSAGG